MHSYAAACTFWEEQHNTGGGDEGSVASGHGFDDVIDMAEYDNKTHSKSPSFVPTSLWSSSFP